MMPARHEVGSSEVTGAFRDEFRLAPRHVGMRSHKAFDLARRETCDLEGIRGDPDTLQLPV